MTASAAEWVPIDSIHPWDRNPRKNDKAAKQLAEWLRRDPKRLWTQPIAAQRGTGVIIAGHTRYKAAHLLEMEVVPVHWMDVDDVEAAQLALADNKLGEKAAWDTPELTRLLNEVADLPTAELMGWDAEELEKLADEVPDFGPLDEPEDKEPRACPHCGGEL